MCCYVLHLLDFIVAACGYLSITMGGNFLLFMPHRSLILVNHKPFPELGKCFVDVNISVETQQEENSNNEG